MSVLVDSSIWISFLKGRPERQSDHLAELLDRREVVLCGPVLAELLAGVGGEARERLQATLLGLDWIDADRPSWVTAGYVRGSLERSGQRAGLIDVLIGVLAAQHGLPLWTADTDFRRIGADLPGLEFHEVA